MWLFCWTNLLESFWGGKGPPFRSRISPSGWRESPRCTGILYNIKDDLTSRSLFSFKFLGAAICAVFLLMNFKVENEVKGDFAYSLHVFPTVPRQPSFYASKTKPFLFSLSSATSVSKAIFCSISTYLRWPCFFSLCFPASAQGNNLCGIIKCRRRPCLFSLWFPNGARHPSLRSYHSAETTLFILSRFFYQCQGRLLGSLSPCTTTLLIISMFSYKCQRNHLYNLSMWLRWPWSLVLYFSASTRAATFAVFSLIENHCMHVDNLFGEKSLSRPYNCSLFSIIASAVIFSSFPSRQFFDKTFCRKESIKTTFFISLFFLPVPGQPSLQSCQELGTATPCSSTCRHRGTWCQF